LDGSEGSLVVDLIGLGQSAINAYNNLTHIRHQESVEEERRLNPRVEDCRLYVSDREGDHSTRYNSRGSGRNGSGITRSEHIRIGYRRENESLVSPCVIHSDEFSDEELLRLGFSPDGTPSAEAIRNYSILTGDEISSIIERRNLVSIHGIRCSYDDGVGD